MAIVKFPRKEIEKHFKLDKENIEKISLFGTPVESLTNKELELEIFPSRPDLISMQNFIRTFKAFLGKQTRLKEYKIQKPQKNYKTIVKSNLKETRPYTVNLIAKNLKLDEEKIKELIQIQEKIHTTVGRNRKKLAIGIYPLNKIKLPITFEAQDPKDIKFVPLEFSKELNGHQILQRHPAGKKYSYLLKGQKKFPVFRDANNKVLSMPPITNSKETGKIDEKTKEIFVEVSGNNLPILQKTLNILATTFAELSAEIYQMKIEYENGKNLITPDLTPKKKKISLETTNKILGLDLKEKELSNLLAKMEHKYQDGIAQIPAWRIDILHEIDLIEEVAIAYGYEKLIPEMPKLPTIGKELTKSKLNSKINNILTGLGQIEISTYHLIKKEEAKKMKLKNIIELEDSKTDYKILRQNLLTPLLRILSENTDVEYPQKLFEIGKVFHNNSKTETGIEEKERLVVGLTSGNFTEAKQTLNYLMRMLELEYTIKESEHQNLIEGRTGKIILNEKEIGFIGEVHPNTLINWNLKMPLSIIEIDLKEIYEKLQG